jgi:hypothetical protein
MNILQIYTAKVNINNFLLLVGTYHYTYLQVNPNLRFSFHFAYIFCHSGQNPHINHMAHFKHSCGKPVFHGTLS